ncbi:ISAzo13-like element transposase-related protein [Georgenia muralis]|uniref:ISAzo13-like element transposase-related protein n=1 Tax=Georgenia muralis TaxID=154117 RepID=UPI002483270E|nr:hypothetical protein [Georgenia muralis]
MDPGHPGDPMSPLVWTTRPTRKLAAALTEAGQPVSDRTVARMLRDLGFSLQGNAKVFEGADGDIQSGYLAGKGAHHLAAGQSVISVDTNLGLSRGR